MDSNRKGATSRMKEIARRWTRALLEPKDAERGSYVEANRAATISAVIAPDNPVVHPGAGARMVVNMAAPHVPALCRAVDQGESAPYKNCYDLAALRVGQAAPESPSDRRLMVDAALPLPPGRSAGEVYFGAVELTGCGIRFYGDICLVLKPDAVAGDTVLLDRNSWDVAFAPVAGTVTARPQHLQHAARAEVLRSWSGTWRDDLGAMAARQVRTKLGDGLRRWTTGAMAEALRSDEDYMEVLRLGSFGTAQLQEARVAASDAAFDALVGDRLRRGPTPSLSSLLWRHRRARAEQALQRHRVPVRVVTTSGRTKG